jgi:Holliday junction resolvase RusA-like endonuclease
VTTTAPAPTTLTAYKWEDQPALTITVTGLPAAQGSKAYKGHRTDRVTGRRKPILVEQSKRVTPWRNKVSQAAVQALIDDYTDRYDEPPRGRPAPLSGAIRIDVVFTMHKPVNAPKRRRTYPAVSPDLDKIQRATFDALTDAKVWEDDGRVIQVTATKAYPNEHPDALAEPGAIIRLYTLPGAQS